MLPAVFSCPLEFQMANAKSVEKYDLLMKCIVIGNSGLRTSANAPHNFFFCDTLVYVPMLLCLMFVKTSFVPGVCFAPQLLFFRFFFLLLFLESHLVRRFHLLPGSAHKIFCPILVTLHAMFSASASSRAISRHTPIRMQSNHCPHYWTELGPSLAHSIQNRRGRRTALIADAYMTTTHCP